MTSAALPMTELHVATRKISFRYWPLAAMVLVLALQCIYFTGVINSDDLGYYELSQRLAAGETIEPLSASHMTARFVFIAIVYLATHVVPNSPWALALPSATAYATCLALLWHFACKRFNLTAATLAILIFGLVPINIVIATVGLPDMTAAAVGLIALALAAAPLLNRDTPRAGWRCLAAGFLLSMTFNIKEPTVFILPGLLLFVLTNRRREGWAWKRAAVMIAGAVIWFVIAELYLYWLTGEALFHFKVVKRTQRIYQSPHVEMTVMGLLRYWTEYLRWLIERHSFLTPMGWVLLAGFTYRFWKRTTVTNLLICAVLPGLVYISMGSSELTDYYPLIHQPRHIIPFLPAMALIAASGISEIWQARKFQGGMPKPKAQACCDLSRILDSISDKLRRPAMAIVGLGILLLSAKAPNQIAGRWYHAQTFAAGYQLAKEHLDDPTANSRLCASGMTRNRFAQLHNWLACPEVELIEDAPQTAEAWIERYGGSYVLTTRFDRIGPYKKKHTHLTLAGEPMAALSTFEPIAHQEPPQDRLNTIRARLTGQPVPTVPDLAVELWRIPTEPLK